MKFSLEEIFAVIDKVTESGLSAFTYEDVDTKISIQGGERSAALTDTEAPRAVSGETAAVVKKQEMEIPSRFSLKAESAGHSETAVQSAVSAENGTCARDCGEITSMMVGTFYAAPSEEAEPFVRVGDQVKKGQTVGIVEAMKLMNEIESEYDGAVEEILVKNGQLVEYGQVLMRIRKESL